MKSKKICGICDAACGAYEQYELQQNGYSICPDCLSRLQRLGVPDEHVEFSFGKPGINYGKEERNDNPN